MIGLKYFQLISYVALVIAAPSFAVSGNTSLSNSIDFDFAYRDQLPETDIPANDWNSCCGAWGPWPLSYPKVAVPDGVDFSMWNHDRVIAVAEHFLGLPYAHQHIPKMGGLDCSNFTSWIYNFGFGIQLSSNVHIQADTAGRKLDLTEPLKPGDLLFIWNKEKSTVGHVAVFMSDDKLIDETDGKVAIRSFSGWYKARFAWARRIIE